MKNKNKKLTIAVAGNPNCGKSTLINAIAGTRLQVGNWPGVTVEKKEATLDINGVDMRFVDLPGSYSLTPYTEEEIVARDFLTQERPDVIVNVVDANNLERSFNLTIQLLELNIPVILALNMYDEIEEKGFKIDIPLIEQSLGVKVIPTIAVKKKGTKELLDTLTIFAKGERLPQPVVLNYGEDLESAITTMTPMAKEAATSMGVDYPLRWLSLKLVEKDKIITELMAQDFPEELWENTTKHMRHAHSKQMEAVISDERFALANGLAKLTVKPPSIARQEITDKIDKVILNRWIGIPIFLAAMWLLFKLTFDVGNPFVDWLDAVVSGPITHLFELLLSALKAPDWVHSLMIDGVVAGVGGVLVFVPIIFFMMFFITFLEGSGYMARAAFLMDSIMHKMGLHGKSFIPLILGFGCNVPSIYATRVLENPRDRKLTAMLSPLMSCSARLPVYVLFAGVFFPRNAGTVIWSLYLLGILMAFIMGIIFKKTLFRGESHEFIMELPPYRMPSFSNLMVHTWDKVEHFIKKAGTVILGLTMVIWMLSALPWGVKNKRDSFMGKASAFIAPVFKPLGFGTWQASASLITGLGAKELVVSSMNTIYVGEDDRELEAMRAKIGVSNSTITLVEKVEETPDFGEDMKTLFLGGFIAGKDAILNIFTSVGIKTISAEPETENMVFVSNIVTTKAVNPINTPANVTPEIIYEVSTNQITFEQDMKVTKKLEVKLKDYFTPLSALSFIIFILLYVPCFTFIASMVHEFNSWKWAGITVAYQLVLAWVISFLVYQGGTLLGFG